MYVCTFVCACTAPPCVHYIRSTEHHANTLILQLNRACKWVPAVCSQWGGYHEAAPAQLRSHPRPPGSFEGSRDIPNLSHYLSHSGSGHSISPLYMPSMQQQECLIYPPNDTVTCALTHIRTFIPTYVRMYVHICMYMYLAQMSVGQLIAAHMYHLTTHTCTKSLVQVCEDTYVRTYVH